MLDAAPGPRRARSRDGDCGRSRCSCHAVLLPGGRAHLARVAEPGRRALWTVTGTIGVVLEILTGLAIGFHSSGKHSDRPVPWLATTVTAAFLLAGAALLAILLGAAARSPVRSVPIGDAPPAGGIAPQDRA